LTFFRVCDHRGTRWNPCLKVYANNCKLFELNLIFFKKGQNLTLYDPRRSKIIPKYPKKRKARILSLKFGKSAAFLFLNARKKYNDKKFVFGKLQNYGIFFFQNLIDQDLNSRSKSKSRKQTSKNPNSRRLSHFINVLQFSNLQQK